MSCFWNSLLNTIKTEDKDKYFNTFDMNLTPHNLAVILKEINKKTENVLWNNEELTEQQMNENKEAIDNYNKNTVNDGYYCSTCDPFLILLADYLSISIEHNYDGNIMTYKHKKNNRYIIKISSDRGHCWC